MRSVVAILQLVQLSTIACMNKVWTDAVNWVVVTPPRCTTVCTEYGYVWPEDEVGVGVGGGVGVDVGTAVGAEVANTPIENEAVPKPPVL